MIKLGGLVLFFVSLISMFTWRASDSGLGIRKFVSPDYPNVARQAQVSGDVRLLAKVAEDGRVETADVLSGPPVLASHAQRNILSWQFTRLPKDQKIEVVYQFRLHEPRFTARSFHPCPWNPPPTL